MISHLILPQRRLILVRSSGVVTLDELAGLAVALHQDPLYDRGFDGISDLRGQTQGPSPQELKQHVSSLKADPRYSLGRWAFIASAPADTALGYFFGQLFDGGANTSVFSSLEAALAWLRPGVASEEVGAAFDQLA